MLDISTIDPRREARERVAGRFEVRVLEPSPPADTDPAWFADDPVAVDRIPPGATALTPMPSTGITWDALARHELIDSRRATLATLRVAMGQRELTEDQLSALMRSINDLRLVVGTRLDVSEDDHPRVHPGDPTFPDWLAYDRLTHLLAQIIRALSAS